LYLYKRLEQLKQFIESNAKLEEEALLLDIKNNERAKVIEGVQLYCAEFIGMIREKNPVISQLKEDTLKGFISYLYIFVLYFILNMHMIYH
jgi:hypothetical protein